MAVNSLSPLLSSPIIAKMEEESYRRCGLGFHDQSLNNNESQQDLSQTFNYDHSFEDEDYESVCNNKSYFDLMCLQDLCTKSNAEVISLIVKKERDFNQFISQSDMAPNLFVLSIRILSKVCESSFTKMITSILIQTCSTNFLKLLENYIKKLHLENTIEKKDNSLYHEDISRFWSDLIVFFKKVLELIPKTACNRLTTIVQKINSTIPSIEILHNYKIDNDVKNTIKTIFQELEQKSRGVDSALMNTNEKKEQDMLESFRNSSVIPTLQDLFYEQPLLRPCKIKDPYDSVEHYLDIQFRLYRADFMKTLQSGVQEYLESNENRNSDFRVYKNAKLINYDLKKKDAGIKVYFGKLQYVDWHRTKRLIFGSLVILCKNNFETVLFATVKYRDIDDLINGYITIEPCIGTIITPNMFGTNYLLLEPKVYFKPYYEVLTAMKNIYDDNFPMVDYLVKAKTSTHLPKYLRHEPVLKYKKEFDLPVGLNKTWPSSQQLGLDESQHEALKYALTQEFVIVQGPPGTGKTFLALEIVRTLLENDEHWEKFGPIIVVCLTNHALDQFLEGILHHTQSILRLGSRSQSDVLKNYLIVEKRRGHRFEDRFALFNKYREIEDLLSTMHRISLNLAYLKTPNVIVPLSCFEYCKDSPHKIFRSQRELLFWLMGADTNFHLKESNLIKETVNGSNITISRPFVNDEMLDLLELCDSIFLDQEDKFENSEWYHLWETVHQDIHGPIRATGIYDYLIKSLDKYIYDLELSGEMYLPFSPLAELENDVECFIYKRMALHDEVMQHPLLSSLNIKSLNPRWQKYWNWVATSYEILTNKMMSCQTTLGILSAELHEMHQLRDLELMRQHKIIGLTTTHAAQIQSSLRDLAAPIVLIEEAAEILEAHVMCSLTKDCQHVIMIGDHKQLRPKASVYELGTQYNLNISLFERMVNIRGNCMQLTYQHRMRPEIAKLITPSIYKTLYNHASVLDHPNVIGVEKNVFFLHHSNREQKYNKEETYENNHEVKFLTEFAKYLLLQGYKPSEITILSAYSGQLFAFKKATAYCTKLKDVRITTVDNFQGEENKIILLSLVRNNNEGIVGFLKEENRVCVALSRAREGLYITGNMNNLVATRNIWTHIKKVLENDKELGESLTLRCANHPDQITEVKTGEDFKKCPLGGCSKKCNAVLPCKHLCTQFCHILDKEHILHCCEEECDRKCPNGHPDPCPLLCFQKCKPCAVKVQQLLNCSHLMDVPCSIDPEDYKCPKEVEVELPECNHKIFKPCHISIDECLCTHDCEIPLLTCSHSCAGPCHAKLDPLHLMYECKEKCTKINIDCTNNHICQKQCYEKCDRCTELVAKTRECGHYYPEVQCSSNINNVVCQKRCGRELDCGHPCELKCCEDCATATCNKKCQKILPCSHTCANKCKEPCATICKVMVPLKEPGLCGHTFSVPCHLQNTDPKSPDLVKYCQEPCNAKLSCSHLCLGKCGSCLQGRIHVLCTQPCTTQFICGHSCTALCYQECPPCTHLCNFQCTHSKCNKKCGQLCVPCKKPCGLQCKHQRCKRKCCEDCDLEPCMKPCEKLLRCRHQCIGYCGDPCPPFCRLCDYADLINNGICNKENIIIARFIYLKECGHCIESQAFFDSVTIDSNKSDGSKEIKMPVCPQCKIPIRSCRRIVKQIKANLKDLNTIKDRTFSNKQKDLKQKLTDYLEDIKNLENQFIFRVPVALKDYIQHLKSIAGPVKNKKKQILIYHEIKTLKILIDILTEISSVLRSIGLAIFPRDFIDNQVKMLVEKLPTKLQISKQRLIDLQLEIRRLILMVEVRNLFPPVSESKNKFNNLAEKLSCMQRFTDEVEKNLIYLSNKEMSKEHKIDKIKRATIVKAVSLEKGYWFKCHKGHLFTISNFDGVNSRGLCLECKASIESEGH